MLKKIAIVGGVVAVTGLGLGGAAAAWDGTPVASAGTAVLATTAAPGAVGAVGAVGATTAATVTKAAPTGKGTAEKKAKHAGRKGKLEKRLARVSHAQWVSKDGRTGEFVTHDAIRGEVTAVTSAAITVKAADNTTETFAVNSSTKVRVAGTKGDTSLGKVKVGDRVGVVGTGTGTLTATHVIDRGPKGAKKPSSTTASTTAPTPAPTTS